MMVQAMEANPFFQEVQSIAETVGPVPDSRARAFLHEYPIDIIFRELSGPQITGTVIDNVRIALSKVFNTPYGSSLLSQLVPYAAGALQSAAAPPLRQLAVQQLSRLLASSDTPPVAQPGSNVAKEQQDEQQELILLLLGALADEDIGVSVEAENALSLLGRTSVALEALIRTPPASIQLHQMAASQDPEVSIRALTLVLRLAEQSPQAAAAVQEAGLLAPLLKQIQNPVDILSCTAALQLVKEAAEKCDAGMAAALGDAVLPSLGQLLEQGQDPVLQCSSLQAGAALLSATLEAGIGPMAEDAPSPSSSLGGAATTGAAATAGASPFPVLGWIKAVLDVAGSQEYPQELEEAALDAVGSVGLKASGARAILQDPSHLFYDVAYKALGRAPNTAIRIVALHAVAAVAGAERAAAQGRGAAALLGSVAEEALRTALFDGALASSPTATPAAVMLDFLRQPFLELRVGTYRALTALLTRDWAAAAVCAHDHLLAFLLNPQSESSRQGCEWRYACVRVLSATIRMVLGSAVSGAANGVAQDGSGQHHAVMAAAAQRVDDAVIQGPYGAHRTAPEQFQVATMPRGGGA